MSSGTLPSKIRPWQTQEDSSNRARLHQTCRAHKAPLVNDCLRTECPWISIHRKEKPPSMSALVFVSCTNAPTHHAVTRGGVEGLGPPVWHASRLERRSYLDLHALASRTQTVPSSRKRTSNRTDSRCKCDSGGCRIRQHVSKLHTPVSQRKRPSSSLASHTRVQSAPLWGQNCKSARQESINTKRTRPLDVQQIQR